LRDHHNVLKAIDEIRRTTVVSNFAEAREFQNFLNTPTVTIKSGKPVTTSRAVAAYFLKDHAYVCRAIHNLVENAAGALGAYTFVDTPWVNPQNGQTYREFQNFLTRTIRTVTLDGNPWFVAADVLAVLDLDKSRGAGHYTKYLGADETRIVTPRQMGGLRTGQAKLLSESGLYKLVMRSDKPEAREFQDWVTRVVLPATSGTLKHISST
jgi:phage regulator Rha-like protein